MKVCKKHGLCPHKKRKDNAGWKCVRCNAEAVTRHRRKKKAWAVAYKGDKCQTCGYSRCIDALDFHHRDRATKEFGLAKKFTKISLEALAKELDKCDLLCANCHREIESRE